jgi:alpha(1,3/1,4) fucosyltransferase
MLKVKIDFADFWRGFDKSDNYFIRTLSKRFDIQLSDEPDFLIYSCYGRDHRKYNCTRIFYTSENVRPNLWECDYAFSFDYGNTDQHYRLPLYVLYDDVTKLTRTKDIDSILSSKTKFCNFLYSNSGAKERLRFFEELSKYRKVDSGGKVMNNIGRFVNDKLSFISDYRFTIAFENSSFPGYTTEKIFHPMLVNSVPIYWGNPKVSDDFNDKSFINVHSHASFRDVIEHIVELDNNKDALRKVLAEPYFKKNEVPEPLRENTILNRFERIFSQSVDKGWIREAKKVMAFGLRDVRMYGNILLKNVRQSI